MSGLGSAIVERMDHGRGRDMVGFLPEDSTQQLLLFAPKCNIKLLDGVCAMRQRVALNARVLRVLRDARHVVSCRRCPGLSGVCLSRIVRNGRWSRVQVHRCAVALHRQAEQQAANPLSAPCAWARAGGCDGPCFPALGGIENRPTKTFGRRAEENRPLILACDSDKEFLRG